MSYEFADRLIELRKNEGMSQEELAQRIGLSRQAVSKWERAESAPDISNLVALSDVYGISIDELVHGVATNEQVETEAKETEAVAVVDTGEAEANPEAATDAVDSVAAPAEEMEAEAKAADVVEMPPPDPSTRVEVAEPAATVQEQKPQDPPVSACNWQPTQPPAPAAAPAAPTPQYLHDMYSDRPRKPKSPLMSFPYPILCVVVYLALGFVFGWWHPAWIIFLTIPFYYWIAAVVVHDPLYAERHNAAGE